MKLKQIFSILLSIIFICLNCLCVYATDYEAEAEERKDMTVESNLYENWPAGPKIGAQSAILIEANTGVTLYEKNIHDKLYPASVTKILTALIAVEKCDLDEMVTFSYDAVNSIDWRTDANMGINANDSITMEQCLYGLLVGSANEAAYAIAEHICGEGNVSDFAKLMNEKAAELGCVDSNFVTPNGIHDENHYTSAYDLSKIATAFFDNELLCKISSTSSYMIPTSDTQPNPDMAVYAKSKLLPGKEYAYDGLVGTKTGYTEYARQTLVSCAEKNGMKLICVILKEESPGQYTDSHELFDYGFNNFYVANISNNDSSYNIQSANSFSSGKDLFGNSTPLIQMDSDDYVILPVGSDFNSVSSSVSYNDLGEDEIARVDYFYFDTYVGSGHIVPTSVQQSGYTFGTNISQLDNNSDNEDNIIVVDILKILAITVGVALILILLFTLRAVFISKRRNRRRNRASKNYEYTKSRISFDTKKRS